MTSTVSTPRVSSPHMDALQKAIHALMAQETDRALKIVQDILEQDPDIPEALHLLGLCAVFLDDLGRGISLIERAHNIDGECREYADALAVLNTQTGNLNDSLYYAKLATTLKPHKELKNLIPENLQNYAKALNNVGVPSFLLKAMVSFNGRNFVETVKLCETELHIRPDSSETHFLMGQSLIEIGEHPRAQAAFHTVEHLSAGHPDTSIALARSLLFQGKFDDSIACFRYAMASDEERVDSVAAQMLALSFMDDAHWATRKALDDILLARAKAVGIEAMEGDDKPAAGKIRIGILADIFYDCSDGLVLEVFLKSYNRERFEVFCYQQSIANDHATDRFKNLCDSWRPVFDLDDFVLANIISSDGIQALIDLSGHGPGQRRAVLASRVAPLQIAWLNHLDGTGKGCIDLIFSDRATLATDRHTRRDHQDIAELETALYVFDEFTLLDEPGPLPAIAHDTITFGAYVDLARLSAQTALMWCNVLRAVPKSLLALNTGTNLPEEIRMSLISRFAHFGMTERVVFLQDGKNEDEKQPDNKDPEQVFLKGIDILLDASVNSTAARIARALWMGVPVLTLDTRRRNGQIAASVLLGAGKSDWVFNSPSELVESVRTLTNNFDDLNAIRQSLRDEIKNSKLFKCRDFARDIETAIEIALEDKDII